MKSRRPTSPTLARKAKPEKLSRTRRPLTLSVPEWQRALPQQFGSDQQSDFKNVGSEPFLSEYRVANLGAKSSYRVEIRGTSPGENYCNCPDYATNELGTCKHIEFTLVHIARRRGGSAALVRGYEPGYSELWLRYGAVRDVYFICRKFDLALRPATRNHTRGATTKARNFALPLVLQ